ncbi:MAG: IS30 family transposase [Nitrospira sp.]
MLKRASLFTIISQLSRPMAQATLHATVQRLKPLRRHVHTITYDNGKEFAENRTTAQCLHTHVFFTTPSQVWEREVNENTNGLIRDFFLKGTDFSTIQFSDRGTGGAPAQSAPPVNPSAVKRPMSSFTRWLNGANVMQLES